MKRNSRRQMVATLVVALGVADGVGIYVAKHKLDKSADISPRDLAEANEPLAEPIAIRTNGELKPALALADSAIAPHADPAQVPQRTIGVALADHVKAETLKAPTAGVSHSARQTAAVVTGRMAIAEKPTAHRTEERSPVELASKTERTLDLRVHQQRIPARLTHAERRPFRDDALATAFGNAQDEVRLPEAAYVRPDPAPRGQAAAELPPLELSTAQIHSEPAADADIPPAPPATAAGADDIQPRS